MESKRGEYSPIRNVSSVDNARVLKNPEHDLVPLSPDMQSILTSFDYQTIKDIFEGLYTRVGRHTSSDTSNVPEVDGISAQDGFRNSFSLGSYWIVGDKIFLNEQGLEEVAKKRLNFLEDASAAEMEIPKEELMSEIKRFLVLNVYFHELHHANSETLYERSNGFWKTKRKLQSGYAVDKVSKIPSWRKKVSSLFNAFNEGVTEKMARETVSIYMKSTADFTLLSEIISRALVPKNLKNVVLAFDSSGRFRDVHRRSVDEYVHTLFGTYQEEQMIVDKLILALSKEFGVPEDMIWGAIKRGYMGTDRKVTEYKKWKTKEGVQSDTLDALLGDPERFAQFAEGHLGDLSALLDGMNTKSCIVEDGEGGGVNVGNE
jgi:hypothetical protein